MTLRQTLTQTVSDAFAACGYDPALGQVTVSNRPDLCQFQCNGALAAAKQYRKPPLEIARQVREKLGGLAIFAKAEVVPPGFLNLNVADAELSRRMNTLAGDERLGIAKMHARTILVDYGGPNIAKPLHVGHLRSAIIGDCLCRLARFLGHRVIGDTHLGDWGLQMGMVIAELQREQPDLPYFDAEYQGPYPEAAPVDADQLNLLYPRAAARAKEDKDFAALVASATLDLQNKRPGYYALWQQIRNVSMADLQHNYNFLGVHFDLWYGESDADPYVPVVMDLLREKKLLAASEGAQVVDVSTEEDREPMPPLLIVKSNGGELYGTTDLATLYQRMRDFAPDTLWYVVDNRQALHFKQVFRCARMAGILKGDTVCEHIGFGTMNGTDGKPYKTRDGGVMRLSDMTRTVTENALAKVKASEMSMDPQEQNTVARQVGVAAMKIGDMINYRMKDYIFDMERFLQSDGKTGPYLQYAVVRTRSLLAKAQASGLDIGPAKAPASDTERDLMLGLLAAPDTLSRAFEDKAPSAICEAMFAIAGLLNSFYSANRILPERDSAQRASWLALLSLTERMLTLLLSLMGIEVPEHM